MAKAAKRVLAKRDSAVVRCSPAKADSETKTCAALIQVWEQAAKSPVPTSASAISAVLAVGGRHAWATDLHKLSNRTGQWPCEGRPANLSTCNPHCWICRKAELQTSVARVPWPAQAKPPPDRRSTQAPPSSAASLAALCPRRSPWETPRPAGQDPERTPLRPPTCSHPQPTSHQSQKEKKHLPSAKPRNRSGNMLAGDCHTQET